MKRLIALFLVLVAFTVSAQTTQTTSNILSTVNYTGAVTGTHPHNCCTGGPTPLYDPADGVVHFSYGQATVAKTIAINNALQGSGVQVNGYNWSYDMRNMNGWAGGQGGVDTITATTQMTSNTGAVLLSNTTTHNTTFDWTTFTGTKSIAAGGAPYALNQLGNLSIGFTSRDGGFWGGYYGPQVRNVGMSLNYTVDPCVTNPAYSPSCANYNTVVTSNNLVPNPGAYAYGGYSIDQSYAINQALGQSGSGVMIHGFQWGYIANTNGPYCDNWFLVCFSTKTPTVTTSVNITDNNNNSIYSVNRTYQNSYNTTNYQYVFPSSRNLATLGSFNFTGTTNDQGAFLGEMWSKALYTPDPCTVNPLSSTTCSGYQQAYHDQQCSANPLYATDCAGYQQAYLTQQCSANPLYSPSCPGYQQAYLTQQCNINPLYSSDCPGYAVAYKNQQCSANALYATDCPGYATAYHDQQCSLNPLYATDCVGYQQAYLTQQCNISQLYSTSCPGYRTAYHDQQCSLNALYMSDCPGYQEAYFSQQCTANPLYNSQCPGYAVAYKNQQCSLSALYATDCPGYATAYHDSQCTANPLYMSDCTGYQAAYLTQQCNISQLYSTSCPNYQQAYFAQQCQLNGLYDRTCPNYASAYAAKNILATPVAPVVPTTVTAVTTTSTATTTTNPAAVAISDPVVSNAVTSPSTTSATSPTSVTSVVTTTAPAATAASPTAAATAAATAPPPPPTPAAAQAQAVETKKADTAVASVEKKAGGNQAAAKAAATERAKELANEAGKASTMEAQAATQGLVVGLMGYVPGFSAYQNSMVPDTMANSVARQYHKPTVDNRNAQRRLSGASELRWQEMVDSQYKQ